MSSSSPRVATRDTPDMALAVVPSSPAPDLIKEMIFETWLFLADRNAAEALRLVKLQLAEMAPEDRPLAPEHLPTPRTIQRWVKYDAWEQRGNDHMRRTAKTLDDSQIARMFAISNLALSFAHQLLKDGYSPQDRPSVLAVKWDAAKEMLKFRGLGTAGVLGAPTLAVTIEAPDTSVTLDGLSMAEKAEMMRQHTLEGKQMARLTGKAAKA